MTVKQLQDSSTLIPAPNQNYQHRSSEQSCLAKEVFQNEKVSMVTQHWLPPLLVSSCGRQRSYRHRLGRAQTSRWFKFCSSVSHQMSPLQLKKKHICPFVRMLASSSNSKHPFYQSKIKKKSGNFVGEKKNLKT